MSKFNMHVKTIINNEAGKILLLKENTTDRKKRWDLPGAPLSADESFDEALVKNIQHQTGYYIYPTRIVGITDYNQYSNKHLTIIMESVIINGDIILNDEEYKWIRIEEITNYPLVPWLKNYIKNTGHPFNDVADLLSEYEQKQNIREEMLAEKIISENKAFKDDDIKENTGRGIKSSFGLLKDAIKRTFRPKKAEIHRTEPKDDAYTTYRPEEIYDEVDEEAMEIITTQHDDDIIIEHDDAPMTTYQRVPTDGMVDEASFEEAVDHTNIFKHIKEENMVDEIVIDHEDDDEPSPIQSKYIKSKGRIRNHDVKIIKENTKTPHIRKEKVADEKVRFSAGVNKSNWKEKLNQFNRTNANDKKKQIPHPKGKR